MMLRASMNGRLSRWVLFTAASIGLALSQRDNAELIPMPAGGYATSGISMDAKGNVHYQEPDAKALDEARARAKAYSPVVKDKEQKLAFISIPRLIPLVKELQLREKPIPEEVLYLGGLTQIRYIFVYPDERDLLIAGPCEPWDVTNPVQPVGKVTGRPIIEMDDLIAALRTAHSMRRGGENGGAFGCTIYPSKGTEERIAKVSKEYAYKPRPEKIEAITKVIGAQKVKVFNTNDDTRTAFICVAADCKLKRIALGVEPAPVPAISTLVESRAGVPQSRVWFELAYQPLLTNEEGTMFELRGQRLQVKVGEEQFTDKDATRRAVAFAKQFNDKIPPLCAAIPAFADLQNLGDLAMVTSLIKLDRLDDKIKGDFSPVRAVIGWSIQNLPAPQSVDPLVAYTNGAIVYGGVSLNAEALLDPETRKKDTKKSLDPIYDQGKKLLDDPKAGPVWSNP